MNTQTSSDKNSGPLWITLRKRRALLGEVTRQQKSHLLSLLIQGILLVVSFSLVYMMALMDFNNTEHIIRISMFATGIATLGLALLLNKRGHYLSAVFLTVFLLPVSIFVAVLTVPIDQDVDDMLIYLVAGILICGALTNLRITIYFTIFNVAGTLLIGIISPEITFADTIYVILFLLTVAAIFISYMLYNQQIARQRQEILLTNEHYFSHLFESLFQNIALVKDGKVLEATPGFAHSLGYDTSADLIGKPPLKKILPADLSWETPHETTITHSSEKRYFNIIGDVHVDDPAIKIIVLQDITTRKQYEVQLQRQNEYLTALHETAIALMNRLHLMDLLQAILNRASRLLEATHGEIGLVDDSGEQLITHVAIGYFAREDAHKPPVQRGEGIMGMAWQKGETINLHDYDSWEERINKIPTGFLKATVCVPFKARNRIMGTMALAREQPGYIFQDNELELLKRFAELAALAIDNAALYTDARREIQERKDAEKALHQYNQAITALHHVNVTTSRTMEQLDEALQNLVDTTKTVFPQSNVITVQLIDSEKGSMQTRAASPRLQNYPRQIVFRPGYGAAGIAYQERQIINIQNVESDERYVVGKMKPGYRSLLVAPLISGKKVHGTLSICSPPVNAFTERDEALADMLARQVAVIIEKAELYTAERTQRLMAEALSNSAALMNKNLSLNSILKNLLTFIEEVIPYDSANVVLINPEGHTYFGSKHGSRNNPGIDEYIDAQKIHVSEIPSFQQMYTTGKPLTIPRTADYEGWKNLPHTEWIKSYVSAPIRYDDQIIGFLNLNSATPDFYSADYADQIQTFADQAGIAIRNARLFEQVQAHARDLEIRVTERTHDLEKERAQLEAILDAMAEGVLYTEYNPGIKRLEILYANRAFSELTGLNFNELTGQSLVTVMNRLFQSSEVEGILENGQQHSRKLVNGTTVSRSHVTLYNTHNQTIDASITITAAHTEHQTRWQVMLFRDISQEKMLEQQKTRFVANASHELRTPLTNIKTRVYLLRKQPEHFERHMDVVDQMIDRMTHLIEELLDISRFERGIIPLHRTELHYQPLIQEVIFTQQVEAQQKNIQLNTVFPRTPIYLFADASRITQVITNLVINAINYTDPGGQIEVDLQEQEGYAILSIQDTGAGIPEDQLTQIFEPFFRASTGKTTGTGLGLTIAREIIELHKGSIEVESYPGEGSTFMVYLPTLNNQMAE